MKVRLLATFLVLALPLAVAATKYLFADSPPLPACDGSVPDEESDCVSHQGCEYKYTKAAGTAGNCNIGIGFYNARKVSRTARFEAEQNPKRSLAVFQLMPCADQYHCGWSPLYGCEKGKPFLDADNKQVTFSAKVFAAVNCAESGT